MTDKTEHDEDADRRRPLSGRLSEILTRIAVDESRERVSLADLFSAMGDRAFGALLLIFALPNVLPSPPGTSAITGAPLVFLSAQLMLGQTPWLPAIIADRSMARTDFAVIVTRIRPWLARAERMLKPRLTVLTDRRMDVVTGLVSLLLAIILALPIPLGNIFPAIAICLFAFGLLERDGLCVLIGFLVSMFSVTLVAGVLFAIAKGVMLILAASFK
ncbi:exopolysaccharide biosynthesis protein [Pseudomonas sp. R2.Fl]|nr:exopolysaccharide biosynthesis protein [Pseudomonas sp. R2.Fl]